jgi:hypothetical protein
MSAHDQIHAVARDVIAGDVELQQAFSVVVCGVFVGTLAHGCNDSLSPANIAALFESAFGIAKDQCDATRR